MRIVKTIGNRELLEREKTLFLCSKRTPIEVYGEVFQWVDLLSREDCIVCFDTTDMEKEVLKALLVNGVPTILVVMNSFRDVNNVQIERALDEKRMLIAVLKVDEARNDVFLPRVRNEFVASQVQRIVCGYVNKYGSVSRVVAGKRNVEFLVGDGHFAIAAEPDSTCYRWTVAEDKMLLRMFYDDMGIHAIKKKLCRSYQAVLNRIRSIAISEEALKGREFEDYVLSLFRIEDGGDFVLKEWRGDKTQGGVFPENNRYPDFVLEYNKADRLLEFAVECKWRAHINQDADQGLFSPEKTAAYQAFAERHGTPVYMVLGVGGKPCEPEQVFLIPLQEMAAILSQQKPISYFVHNPVDSVFAASDFLCVD